MRTLFENSYMKKNLKIAMLLVSAVVATSILTSCGNKEKKIEVIDISKVQVETTVKNI